MKSLVLVDVPQLWHGIKRVTGDPKARLDYVRLRKELSESPQDVFIAYLACLVSARGGHPLRDDSNFTNLLNRSGYLVHRSYVPVKSGEMGPRQEDPTASVYGPALTATITRLPEFDVLRIVSGSGGFIPMAEHAKELGKTVVVYSFGKLPSGNSHKVSGAGDLNPTLHELADCTIFLNASYVYDPVAVRNRQKVRSSALGRREAMR